MNVQMNDGTSYTKFYENNEELKKAFAETVANPEVKQITVIPKVGRNHPCPCGSGKKAKKCCWSK